MKDLSEIAGWVGPTKKGMGAESTNNHYNPIASPDFSNRLLTLLDIIVILPFLFTL
jgi:hypothetical protein